MDCRLSFVPRARRKIHRFRHQQCLWRSLICNYSIILCSSKSVLSPSSLVAVGALLIVSLGSSETGVVYQVPETVTVRQAASPLGSLQPENSSKEYLLRKRRRRVFQPQSRQSTPIRWLEFRQAGTLHIRAYLTIIMIDIHQSDFKVVLHLGSMRYCC